MKLLPADLVLVRGTDAISKAIEDVTQSAYSHVAIVTGPNELTEAQGMRKVGRQDIGRYSGIADVYRCNFLTTAQREAIVKSVKSHIGQHYDYLLLGVELIRYVFGIALPWYEHDSVICSTLAADGYRDAGLDPCPGIAFPSPADIAGSSLFIKVGSL